MLTPDHQQSLLIQALERIFCCIEAKAPRLAPSLQPGLTREQIETQLQVLPFRLPEEVYQLYQWRNGSLCENQVELLPQYRMMPLQEAILERQAVYEIVNAEPDEDEACHWLPFLAMDSDFYVIQGDFESK
ncbi:MAG: SMI1/KNR4 family protein [Leptolyngbyaceae cyanobacterium CRU_2_3]|nr:SMI1/KNR4 family protein [Leptolyngbyaceae cyanobacterium CRU_2_3]